MKLFHRHGFAGQGGLADKEIFGRNQPKIGWNDRSGLKNHDVARHNLRDGNLTFFTFAENQAVGVNHGLKFFNRPAGAMFLDVGQHDTEDQHGRHHHSRPNIPHKQRNKTNDDELNDQRIAASLEDFPKKPNLFFGTKIIGPVQFPGIFHLG